MKNADMQKRTLANSLGVFQSPPEETAGAIESAIAQGYRLIDTAAAYLNERRVGEGLRRSGIPREDVFLEKVWITDYGYDATLHAFAIGVSNFMADHLRRLLAETSVVPAVNQIELHPYFQQTALQRLDAEHGVLTQAWSPIGGITSYFGGGKSAFDDSTLQEIARGHGKSPAQVMLRWHLQAGRSAIPKPTKPARIAENFDVFDFELSSDEVAGIDALDTGVRRGPDPDTITLEAYGMAISEA